MSKMLATCWWYYKLSEREDRRSELLCRHDVPEECKRKMIHKNLPFMWILPRVKELEKLWTANVAFIANSFASEQFL